MIALRPFSDEHLEEVLSLIRGSDSTNRSSETWNANGMTAVTAFDGGRLIGALPLERRAFSLGDGRFMDILWISAAHVLPEYRGRGIGTAMDGKIDEYFMPERKAVFVYRGDETSLAYKWYAKLGYREVLPILSFKKDVARPQTGTGGGRLLLETEEDFRKWEGRLHSCFNRNAGLCGGFPKRPPWFWSDKFRHHYYKEFYRYGIMALTRGEEVSAYAFIGETSLRDDVPRIDILELICPEDGGAGDELLGAVMGVAFTRALKEVRIQVSSQEPLLKRVREAGFTSRMRFSMMARIADPAGYLRERLIESVDLENGCRFIVQSPEIGERVIGRGKRSLRLSARGGLLNEMLLCRCDIENAVDEGRLVVMDGDLGLIPVLSQVFPFRRWRYFHIDYV